MPALANFDYPGVKVTEAPAGAIPIDRLGFRSIKLTGTAPRGPAGLNKNPMTREQMYNDLYGGASTTSFLDDAVKAIFMNSDVSLVFINRILGAGSAVATKTLNATATPTLKIDSIGPGASYNYVASPAAGISITYVGGDLSVFDAGVLKEVYHDVTVANFAVAADFVNANSNLIQISWLSTVTNPDDAASAQGLLAGADGAAVVAADIAGNSATFTGVYAYMEKTLPLGFILAPGYPTSPVGVAMIAAAEGSRQMAIIDSTLGTSASGAITERNQYASPRGHAIYCYGWVQVFDQLTNQRKYVPRSPYRAAHICRSHSDPGGIANVGAGLDFTLRGAIGIETGLLDDLGHGALNIKGIDVARNFTPFGQGLVSFSARTISTNPLYRFDQVRIILNVIEESIEIGLRPYVFKVYDGRGRVAHEMKASIDSLLWDLWNADSLFGSSPQEAFLVKNVSSLNELEQGIISIEVYVKPTPIVERVNVTVFRVPLSFNFTNGEVTVGTIESQA